MLSYKRSSRKSNKPVQLAFRDKPESYQAAYRNLVRAYIDDNLTGAFIGRLLGTPLTGPGDVRGKSSPESVSGRSHSSVTSTQSLSVDSIASSSTSSTSDRNITGYLLKPASLSVPFSLNTNDPSLEFTDFQENPILIHKPRISSSNTFGQLQSAINSEYSWINPKDMWMLLMNESILQLETYSQKQLGEKLNDHSVFCPLLKLRVVTKNHEYGDNDNVYVTNGMLSYNEIVQQMLTSFETFILTNYYLNEDTDTIRNKYGKVRYIPLNLAKIQKLALSKKPWTAGQSNPLDEPIFRNKTLWEYFHTDSLPISFYMSDDKMDINNAISLSSNGLQIRVTYGNPKFDEMVHLTEKDLLLETNKLVESIIDKLPEDYSFWGNLESYDNNEEAIKDIMGQQKFQFKMIVGITISPKLDDLVFYTSSTKKEVTAAFQENGYIVSQSDNRFDTLGPDDLLLKLDLRKDNTLHFEFAMP